MNSIPLERKAPYEMVKDAVLQKYILRGIPGTKLPSDRELALEYGVNVATVAKGLTSLALEGQVRRRVGSGTYITATVQAAVGVYLGAPTLSYRQAEMVVYARLDELLQRTLSHRPENFLHYVDSRIQEYWGVPHLSLCGDVKAGRLTDLIVVRANSSNYRWIDQLPLHVIGFGANYGGTVVDLDLGSFSQQAVQYLAQKGRRRVGFITKVPPAPSPRSPSRIRLHEAFHETLRNTNLITHPEWIKFETFDNTLSDAEPMDAEMFGYTMFQTLWAQPERPDSLIVSYDIAGLGVIRAARDLGVDLNRDIKTVFAANLGSDWAQLEHFTRLAFPLRNIVDALVSSIGETTSREHLVKPILVEPEDIPVHGVLRSPSFN